MRSPRQRGVWRWPRQPAVGAGRPQPEPTRRRRLLGRDGGYRRQFESGNTSVSGAADGGAPSGRRPATSRQGVTNYEAPAERRSGSVNHAWPRRPPTRSMQCFGVLAALSFILPVSFFLVANPPKCRCDGQEQKPKNENATQGGPKFGGHVRTPNKRCNRESKNQDHQNRNDDSCNRTTRITRTRARFFHNGAATMGMSHDEERAPGNQLEQQRDRAPRHWLDPLASPSFAGVFLTTVNGLRTQNSVPVNVN